MRKSFIIAMFLIVICFSVAAFLFLVEIPVSFVDKSDWKTYHNDKYGFEFKYPKNADLKESEDGTMIFASGLSVYVGGSHINGCYPIATYVYMGRIFGEACTESIEGGLEECVSLTKNGILYQYCGTDNDYGKIRINRDILSTFKFTR